MLIYCYFNKEIYINWCFVDVMKIHPTPVHLLARSYLSSWRLLCRRGPHWLKSHIEEYINFAIVLSYNSPNALHNPLGVSTNTCFRTPYRAIVTIQVNIYFRDVHMSGHINCRTRGLRSCFPTNTTIKECHYDYCVLTSFINIFVIVTSMCISFAKSDK